MDTYVIINDSCKTFFQDLEKIAEDNSQDIVIENKLTFIEVAVVSVTKEGGETLKEKGYKLIPNSTVHAI